MGYTVWRISTRTTIMHQTTGAGYLIPINIISGTPSLGAGCPQRLGYITKYETEVDLTPQLDCIILVSRE